MRPMYNTRRNDGDGGSSSCQSLGQLPHTSSFILPTVVSGWKCIVRLLPETSSIVRTMSVGSDLVVDDFGEADSGIGCSSDKVGDVWEATGAND